MRYFAIVFIMSFLVILYVWQNIEVMKLKMDYKRLVKTEQELSEKNSRLKYEVERLRDFDSFESGASKNGLVRVSPASSVIIRTGNDNNGSKK